MTRLPVSRRRLFQGAALAAAAPHVPWQSVASALAAPAPEPRWLTLIETHVAGTAYYQASDVADSLRPGAPLVLRREPGNPYDARAIEVFTKGGEKLGYVPRIRNPPFAALMDDGQSLRAHVATVAHWRTIRLTIDLRMPTQM